MAGLSTYALFRDEQLLCSWVTSFSSLDFERLAGLGRRFGAKWDEDEGLQGPCVDAGDGVRALVGV